MIYLRITTLVTGRVNPMAFAFGVVVIDSLFIASLSAM